MGRTSETQKTAKVGEAKKLENSSLDTVVFLGEMSAWRDPPIFYK